MVLNKLRRASERYRLHFKRVANFTHLSYFSLVMTHGPYNIAAGVCLAVGIIGWVFWSEGVE